MSDIGSLALVRFEYSDQPGWKVRPGLITGEYLDDYQVMFITSEVGKYSHEDTSMVIDNDDLSAGRLKRKSLVRSHKTFWIEKTQCKKIGFLKTEVTDKILRLNEKFSLRNYYGFAHKQNQPFIPGKTPVKYAGRVYDEKEIQAAVDASLDFWLTEGRFVREFEAELARFVGVKHAVAVNSGSSANLLAVTTLTSPLLGEKRLKPGDEVITVAAGFPTTLNPIIQNRLVPVFVDIDLPTYNAKVSEVEAAVGPKTRAIFLPHTLGNPFDLGKITRIAEEHDLYLIEDNCDSLGSTYQGKNTGGFGHLSTCSFYPAHHITTGEGGAVLTSDPLLARILRSLKDWGRDCYCRPGESNRCGKRFSALHGALPPGYDHRFVYSHIGYNLKMTDIQAAIGLTQLKKLDEFCQKRRENFQQWSNRLGGLTDYFVLPEATPGSDPAWFAFPITVRDRTGFNRTELTNYLAENMIETRNLFAGNLLRQPAYRDIHHRTAGSLQNTDRAMNSSFFLGAYPGMGTGQIEYSASIIGKFLDQGF